MRQCADVQALSEANGQFAPDGGDLGHAGQHASKENEIKEAENNQGRRVRFIIIGKGGVTLEQKLRKSNPWRGKSVEGPSASLAGETKGGTAGGRGCATPCGVVSVGKM